MISSITIYGIKKHRSGSVSLKYLPPSRIGQGAGTQVETDSGNFLYLFGFNEGCLSSGKAFYDFKAVFEDIGEFLSMHGYRPADIVRTWIYMQDINRNYEYLNRARREFFEDNDIDYSPQAPELPASTGIEGRSASSSKLSIDLVCIDKSRTTTEIERVYSKFQNEPDGVTYPHKSTFSRGISIRDHEHQIVHISGTASIDEIGATIHSGDPYGQIKKTIEFVKDGILAQFDLKLSDLLFSTCFFKKEEYYRYFLDICRELGVDGFCNTHTVADICRNDLFFEIDGVAAKHRRLDLGKAHIKK